MKTASSTSVQNSFGEFLDTARSEPVVVTRNGREVAVLMSWQEYERIQRLEDQSWAARARDAEAEGYLGVEATAALLKSKIANE